jgi:mono/diheme cytochrome c family protein
MRRSLLLSLFALVVISSAVALAQTSRRPSASAQSSAAASGAVTFSETIAPIVYANCVTCHRPGQAAPFSLISYEDVAKRGALIARVTESRYMPPWHGDTDFGGFVGERRLTTEQIATIGAWVKQGMPRGDERRMPTLPQFAAEGWQLGQPDLVLEMPAGFDVRATGPDVFRNFVIPTRLTEDKWVRGIEYRPGARKVVHHAIFAAVKGGSLAAIDGADGRPGFGGMGTVGVAGGGNDSQGLGGWAVGATPQMMPEGIAARLPRGSDFLLQVHFHPSGKAETEKSLVGLYFADGPPAKNMMSMAVPALFGVGAGIDIAPGTKDYTIKDSFVLPGDVTMYSAGAHAHYLARQMKATATLPDGSGRSLLFIKDWDFNWQDGYAYKQPFRLPKGTRIDVTITYDNSTDNPRNPSNPPRRAVFGEQSFDEMGAVLFDFEVSNAADRPAFEQALATHAKAAIAAGGKDGTIGRFLARTNRERGPRQQLTVMDRAGAVITRVAEPAFYQHAAMSPDGSQVAVLKVTPETGSEDIWLYDVATGSGRALTNDEPREMTPVWSADGRSIAFVSVRDNTYGIYRRNADGSGAEERLYQHTTGASIFLTDWSTDGRLLTFWINERMYVMPRGGEPVALDVPNARGGRFSPDGRLIAFCAATGEAGRFHVYVMPFDPSSPASLAASLKSSPRQVSIDNAIGGVFWRRDGRELLFMSQPPKPLMMAADVTRTASGVESGTPRVLFALPPGGGGPAQLSSIATPDAERFVFALNLPPRQPAQAQTK